MMQTASFLYQSTLTNPMLSEIYGLEPEMSSLFYMIAGVGFIIFTPIAFQLRSRKIMLRRSIIFMALCVMGFAMIIRTGDLRGKAKIYWVYIG
jgi:predicted MFS family arabinose efflux permease